MSHVLLVYLLTFLRKALNDLNETKEQHCNWWNKISITGYRKMTDYVVIAPIGE